MTSQATPTLKEVSCSRVAQGILHSGSPGHWDQSPAAYHVGCCKTVSLGLIRMCSRHPLSSYVAGPGSEARGARHSHRTSPGREREGTTFAGSRRVQGSVALIWEPACMDSHPTNLSLLAE